MAGWKVGLIILGGVAVVGGLLVAIGGLFFATRYFSGTKPATGIPPAAVVTQGNPLPAEPTPIKAGTTRTPFLTIPGLPDDIPILTDNNGDLMTMNTSPSGSEQGYTIYTFTTKMTRQDLTDFYKNGMANNGWTLQQTISQDDVVSWTFQKGNNRIVQISLYNVKQVQEVSILPR
jgi:hypothetical protein